MIRRVDLHGLDVQKATAVILNALYAFENSYDTRMIIVTGKGTGSLANLVEEILDQERFDWEYENSQHSAFIIYK
ncbi:Smr/MutS family protein [[Mycoplasma] gypis]|uniref:Smr/MutS family protein n=1 Tax=[Mycoplasma] gypis TaxID=92404 RepID=A0ABZ2RRC8_9BACT|nr:Smr/MutS family protein [[Mycoplasma] gypis]MBN0919107.1 Smr/MutS family protein [[Mycoplasma] gypis]